MIEIKLFNINDITVLLNVLVSFLLSFLLLIQRSHGRTKNLLLAGFFLLYGLHALDILLYWNAAINSALAAVSTNLFFVLGFALLLQGPFLYWSTRATLYRDFSLDKKDILHLVPALTYPFYMYIVYYQFDPYYKMQYVKSWDAVKSNLYFEAIIWLQRLSPFVYSVVCIRVLYCYIKFLKKNYVVMSAVDVQWLKLLLVGFFGINSWAIVALLESRILQFGLDSPMGILEIYIRFLFVGILVVYLLLHSRGFADIQVEHTMGSPAPAEDQYQALLNRLTAYMAEAKPYLEPHLTLDRLAERLGVSSKLLSGTINRKLNKNFFELISDYRIEEARARLADPDRRSCTINDIMKDCGFSSKSVFNQAFKKAVGVTPSHYRQQYLG